MKKLSKKRVMRKCDLRGCLVGWRKWLWRKYYGHE